MPEQEPALRGEGTPDGNFCGVCFTDKGDLKGCSRCLGIFYCSRKCQREDWAAHKLLCEAFKNTGPPDAPSPEMRPCPGHGRYVRAILFHPDKLEPEIRWISKKDDDDANGKRILREGYASAEVKASSRFPTPATTYLHTQHSQAPQTQFCDEHYQLKIERRNPINGVCIAYRDDYWLDGSTENKALLRAVNATGRPQEERDWRGPFVFTRFYPYNINMADYRQILRHLATIPWLHMGRHWRAVPQQVCTIKGRHLTRADAIQRGEMAGGMIVPTNQYKRVCDGGEAEDDKRWKDHKAKEIQRRYLKVKDIYGIPDDATLDLVNGMVSWKIPNE